MIVIGFRKNLLYPLMLIFFTTIRKADSILMVKLIDYEGYLFLTIIMFLSEFISGLIIYIYHLNFLSKKRNNSFMGLRLIQAPSELASPDKKTKIYLLIFMSSFFDFNVFLLETYYLPLYNYYISQSFNIRLRSILTLCSALLCYCLLKIPIYKHQIFTLIIIFTCLIIIIASDFYFQENYFLTNLAIIFNFVSYFFNSCLDVTEKYLLEYDYLNPFKVIMLEGIIGLILSSSFSFIAHVNPFKELKNIFKDIEKKTKVFETIVELIIYLAIYFIASGGRNIYRIITNKLYSPMTRTLTDCIIDPLLIIYYFFVEKDFQKNKNEGQNIYFFIINLVASFCIVFCSCVYNELFVLFCCKLEHNTHYEITRRATLLENRSNLSDDSQNQSEKSDDEENHDEKS